MLEQHIQQSTLPIVDNSEEENSSYSPIFDSFYAINGKSSVVKMTNMTSIESEELWRDLQDVPETEWS